MLQSKLFLKTRKTAPTDDVSVNAKLLEQAGFVQKVMAGVYTFLPLGFRVLSKIENIVREEMNAIGGQEVFMPSLHPKNNWEATGRWKDLDVLFKIRSQHGFEYALGPSHEEIVVPMALPVVNSYKDLPLAVYQIQTKFRDEPRAKSGLLRGREFRMKDLYSFHVSDEDRDNYYDKVAGAYTKIFRRLGLESIFTEATGGTFSKYSDEFQVEIADGEDTIYVCVSCGRAKNAEVYQKGASCKWCEKKQWRQTKASEVGNIFKLSDKYPKSFDLNYTAADGSRRQVIMGCYGIGISRAMGVLVEKFHDGKGIIWPKSVSPYAVHLLGLDLSNKEVAKQAEEFYQSLQADGVEVLYDDRQVSPGVKFADSDLVGIPLRVVISPKTLEKHSVEIKDRLSANPKLVKYHSAKKIIQSS
ncbi:MAG: aminoacyl--tRNA ligase-related protein [bacterium]|nr:aminoacyl--tRNA ligase-related protein [bacterium]